MKMGKYKCVYMPNHQRATKEGYVYEHILQAEIKLNRHLTKEEVVHHIDENKYNNNLENLIVFSSRSAHSMFHKGGEIIDNQNGTYSCEFKISKKICPICKKIEILSKYKTCLNCKNIKNSKFLQLNIDEFKKEVYYNSYSSLSEKYDVTDNCIRDWIIKLGIKYYKKTDMRNMSYDDWINNVYVEKITYDKKEKIPNKTRIYQIDENSNIILNIFESISDANVYFGKNKNNGNIKDACRNRKSHMALGYRWYYESNYINQN